MTIAIGCTGGATPFCSFAERIGRELLSDSYNVKISHRDKDRRKREWTLMMFGGNTEPSEEERARKSPLLVEEQGSQFSLEKSSKRCGCDCDL